MDVLDHRLRTDGPGPFQRLYRKQLFRQKYGGTKRGEYAAIVGVVIGMFLYPPFGIIFVPFVLVLIVEALNSKDFNQALKASVGSLLAFLSSAVFNAVVYVLMVAWFLLDALVF